MVTIGDIAREAGVSATTVSNVIHGRTSRVSAQTEELVNEIIRRVEYVPNLPARALKSRSTKVVALINNLDAKDSDKFNSDPFFMDLTAAVEQALRVEGFYLMVRAVSRGDELMEFLRTWNVEGVFAPGQFEQDPLYQVLLDLKMPVVLTDSYVSNLGHMHNVGLQDREGGRLATSHLLQNGHRRIVFASPKIKAGGVVEQRLLGYRQALEDSGVAFDPALVYECEFTTEKMIAMGEHLAAQTDITAVFATADLLAAGIMSGLQQSGRMVPRDISVVGFDDINLCQMTMPMLTTVHQDAAEKGRLAAKCMLQLLKHGTVENSNQILPVRLVSRDSVRKI